MGWFDRFKRNPPKNTHYAEMLDGYTPIFSQFGTDIYASDVVQQAVSCIVGEIKKLRPLHIKTVEFDIMPVKGSIQSVLENPNERMTTSEFLEKMTWQLYLNYNAFAVPTYYVWKDKNGNERRHYTAIYPIAPKVVDFLEDPTGQLFIQFTFANGYKATFPYEDVVHWKLKYSVNEYMGGNYNGQPDNDALLKTLDLNHQLLEGLRKAMKSSFAINGVVKIKTVMDKEKQLAAIKEFEKKIQNSESGILPVDVTNEYIPIDKKIQLVDDKTLKFIDEKILRHHGVSLPILTGDYTKVQYEAFYQKTLEPLIISLQQAFTKTFFTSRERAFGNSIAFYPKDLIFMDISQTLEFVRLLGDSGGLMENEKRHAFGMMPLPELVGVRMQSLNYVNAKYADNYQLGRKPKEREE